jgi:hypothetical protein
MVVPLAASLSKDVAFIINVAGAGVSPHQQMTYQAEAEMRRDGFSEADIAEAVAYLNQKWEVARTGGEGWERDEVIHWRPRRPGEPKDLSTLWDSNGSAVGITLSAWH